MDRDSGLVVRSGWILEISQNVKMVHTVALKSGLAVSKKQKQKQPPPNNKQTQKKTSHHMIQEKQQIINFFR